MFDKNLTAHLAELSKLKFTEKELEKMANEMAEIVNLMDSVNEFETEKTAGANAPLAVDAFRPDKPKSSMPREEVLKSAKSKSETCFKVPKVV